MKTQTNARSLQNKHHRDPAIRRSSLRAGQRQLLNRPTPDRNHRSKRTFHFRVPPKSASTAEYHSQTAACEARSRAVARPTAGQIRYSAVLPVERHRVALSSPRPRPATQQGGRIRHSWQPRRSQAAEATALVFRQIYFSGASRPGRPRPATSCARRATRRAAEQRPLRTTARACCWARCVAAGHPSESVTGFLRRREAPDTSLNINEPFQGDRQGKDPLGFCRIQLDMPSRRVRVALSRDK